MRSHPHRVDVVVIGAGQSGLAMAHELLRRGFVSALIGGGTPGEAGAAGALGEAAAEATTKPRGRFVVLDANEAPGGAWQHRWPSLTMATVNGIAELPGLEAPRAQPSDRASEYVSRYFAEYEEKFALPVVRPVEVRGVQYDEAAGSAGAGSAAAGPAGTGSAGSGAAGSGAAAGAAGADGADFVLDTSAGKLRARFVVNASGTWDSPFLPYYPGHFGGEQVHSHDFGEVERYRGKRVLVVGGGISALDHISDLHGVAASVDWATRTPPRWRENITKDGRRTLGEEWGRAVEERVRADVEAGRPVKPVVENTGLPVTARVRRMREQGLLDRMPMFTELTERGARWADGTERSYDVIIWATGFRPNLRHLAPLHVRKAGGGIQMSGQHVTGHPRLFMIGYGPSASTVGARWASRKTGGEIVKLLEPEATHPPAKASVNDNPTNGCA